MKDFKFRTKDMAGNIRIVSARNESVARKIATSLSKGSLVWLVEKA